MSYACKVCHFSYFIVPSIPCDDLGHKFDVVRIIPFFALDKGSSSLGLPSGLLLTLNRLMENLKGPRIVDVVKFELGLELIL